MYICYSGHCKLVRLLSVINTVMFSTSEKFRKTFHSLIFFLVDFFLTQLQRFSFIINRYYSKTYTYHMFSKHFVYLPRVKNVFQKGRALRGTFIFKNLYMYKTKLEGNQ